MDNENKINWVAWDKILRDKLSGGLGVGSLKALNLAMLGKWWWRDRTESSAKWKVVVNNCNATHSPNINSRGHRGVWRKIQEIDMGINLDYLLQQKEDGSGWIWRLDANNFTVSSLRKLIDSTSLPSAESETEWIKWVPSKANIHLWRTRCNRLATKDNLIKRGVSLQLEECTMCNAMAENLDHVLAQCSSTKIVAAFLSRWVDWWLRSESSISGIWTAIGSISGNNLLKEVRKVITLAYLWTIYLESTEQQNVSRKYEKGKGDL